VREDRSRETYRWGSAIGAAATKEAVKRVAIAVTFIVMDVCLFYFKK
jgi:hypothetical protein